MLKLHYNYPRRIRNALVNNREDETRYTSIEILISVYLSLSPFVERKRERERESNKGKKDFNV